MRRTKEKKKNDMDEKDETDDEALQLIAKPTAATRQFQVKMETRARKPAPESEDGWVSI